MRAIAILIVFIISSSLFAQEKNMTEIPGKSITLDALEEMFQNIQDSTDWNTSKDMLWGYFFTHREPSKLEAAKSNLISQGYNFVGIYLGEKEEPNDPDVYWLHIEKIETHSPKSLDQRNNEFYIYAHEMNIDSYDGMDIGPVEK
jgi:hypothetical protein